MAGWRAEHWRATKKESPKTEGRNPKEIRNPKEKNREIREIRKKKIEIPPSVPFK